jgi:hypothetical protein
MVLHVPVPVAISLSPVRHARDHKRDGTPLSVSSMCAALLASDAPACIPGGSADARRASGTRGGSGDGADAG